ncbi:MAG TPA: hypothetical protein VGT44_08225, partial [Ktedonobacteraceae bacterium]|nr:hypothetical protein [Ktedonobacteraceae bacterium]
IWDAKTAATIATYNGHSSPVLAVAWSPDSTHIASIGHNDNKVQVWSVAKGSCTSIYDRHGSDVFAVAWSPDGTKIASAGYGVHIWQAS